MLDLAAKIKKTEHSFSLRASDRLLIGSGGSSISGRKEAMAGLHGSGASGRDTQLDNIVKDSNKIASEEITGLLASVVKDRIFNGVKVERGDAPTAAAAETER